ncbi:MAG TPA: lysine exporter LysO family protein [Firmicutes bacterium]|jgi:uncharacterized membrane protein YbjE (DUF340 family)|nr:lysine exporter LysO family protein [Bacillota bacterium]
MTWKILSSLAAGLLCGFFLRVPEGEIVGLAPDLALAALVFAVGFSLGEDEQLWAKVKALPKALLAVPFLIAAGSILGAVAVGPLCSVPPAEAALVGAGFGWYSLSGVLVSQSCGAALGTLTLLANIFRETLAILFTAVVAKRFGNAVAVAPGGATAMDVTLPIVAASTDPQTALLAFYSGTVLSILVPIVIPFLAKLVH